MLIKAANNLIFWPYGVEVKSGKYGAWIEVSLPNPQHQLKLVESDIYEELCPLNRTIDETPF